MYGRTREGQNKGKRWLILHLQLIIIPSGLYFPCSDVEKIQAGIGDMLVLFINYITGFLGCVAIAFFVSWKMTLVMCSTLPCLVLMSVIITKVL